MMYDKETLLPKLPPEIIAEILSWLRLKPLVKCQLVCKEWRVLILNHQFMENHMNRSPFIHDVTTPTTTDTTDFFCYEQVFHGLIVVSNLTLGKYILWNPAARLVLELPDPLDGSYIPTLSFAPTTRSYKVVSFFKDKESALLGCRVLTLGGKALAWRQLTIPFPYTVAAHACVGMIPLGRAVHCAMRIKHGDEFIAQVITLDVETESFTLTRFPTGVFRDLRTVSTLEWNGKLALCDIGREDMEVMALEDYKKEKWCKERK